MTFNGKAKSTSQFFYDLKNESDEEALKKLKSVIEEYFEWYATFNNKDPIKEVQLMCRDIVCDNKCSLAGSAEVSIVDLVIPKRALLQILKDCADKFGLMLELSSL